jgi:hypothetical protein
MESSPWSQASWLQLFPQTLDTKFLAEAPGLMGWVPSGYVKIAIENGPFIVSFPIKNGDFP